MANEIEVPAIDALDNILTICRKVRIVYDNEEKLYTMYVDGKYVEMPRLEDCLVRAEDEIMPF